MNLNAMVLEARRLALIFVLACGALPWQPVVAEPSAGSGEVESWRFRVYLDDREIGYHDFFLAGSGEERQLRSVASFEYRLLFVTLFRYQHESRESWSGNCLRSIDSETVSNGNPFRVNGQAEAETFRLSGSEGEQALPPCIMSFAYWNPAFLEQAQLLNSQNGEYLDVQISPPVFEELEVQGELRPSYRYRLAAGALNLDLWYSTDKEWLALESEVKGGRKLRYQRI